MCGPTSDAATALGRESQWPYGRALLWRAALQVTSPAQGMYTDVINHCASCPQCAIVNSSGRVNKPPLHPIPVQRVFQIVGVDVMDLPKTEAGNKHVIMFQDFLSKYPLVFPIPDQKAVRVARLLAKEVIPLFGVPETLLSDRGTNLLSHLVQDLYKMLGIRKLNTTAYHPQCEGW